MKKCIALLFIALSCSHLKAQRIISFFNEQKSPELVKLFKDSSLIPNLQAIHGEIRMGTLDLNAERASVVKRLNEAGVPVVAWLVLTEEDGYFSNSINADLSSKRYQEIKAWANQYQIKLKGIGLDFEIDMNDLKLARQSPFKLIYKMYARLYEDDSHFTMARLKYDTLVAQIKADGYEVEGYYMPYINDEAAAGKTSIQKMARFIKYETGKDIPMLYSSLNGNGDGLLKIYGEDVKLYAAGLGSTGGGLDSASLLSYEQLAHDMNVAFKTVKEVHIFSLEGAVKAGMMPKLLNYKYDSAVAYDQKAIQSAISVQKKVKFISTILSYPTLFLVSILLILTGIVWVIKLIIQKIVKLIKGSNG
jgi:hypothetical protein